MIAFKALGYSMNTGDSKEITAAYEWLKKMNDIATATSVLVIS